MARVVLEWQAGSAEAIPPGSYQRLALQAKELRADSFPLVGLEILPPALVGLSFFLHYPLSFALLSWVPSLLEDEFSKYRHCGEICAN